MKWARGLALTIGGLAACASARRSPSAPADQEPPAYLFSYFVRNGEDGVHLAYSHDGVRWQPLNGGRPVITPAITGSGSAASGPSCDTSSWQAKNRT